MNRRSHSHFYIFNFARDSCKTLYRIRWCAHNFIIVAAAICLSTTATAETASLMGPLGLNTIPSARMDPAGTARVTAATLDPYVHFTAGFQIAEPLFVGVRQTLEVSGINDDPDRLFPGVDVKLRLAEETQWRPAIVLGINSAIGHQRMAGEYIAFSKRYKSLDLTGGIAWGRAGSAGQIDNPLKSLSGHFGDTRTLDGEMPVRPDDWFTGEKAGLFAGLEYFTPIEGLSVKLDWGADRYASEQTASGFDAPSPWSLGLAYRPVDWVDIGGALVGGDKLLGRMTLKSPVESWPGRAFRTEERGPALRPYRTGLSLPAQMEIAAAKDGFPLHNAERNGTTASAEFEHRPGMPLPREMGRAARYMANHAGERVEQLVLTPVWFGLRGPATSIARRDLERALIERQGSAEEIWRNARFNVPESHDPAVPRPESQPLTNWRFGLALDNRFSLAEEDSGLLYRSSLLVDARRRALLPGFLSGMTWRLDIANNLDRLKDYRPASPEPVRSNVSDFARTRVSPDRLYSAWTGTVKNDIHAALSLGYLEEMYSGFGGEVLYRPYGRAFVVGTEAFIATKRDPDTFMTLGLLGPGRLTGHVNAWYEVPDSPLTVHVKAGRFLAGDTGARLALLRSFDNGATLEGFVTVTNASDPDIFGGATHVHNGLRLALPLGNLSPIPETSRIRLAAEPFGRDSGQTLDKPIDLYEITRSFSHRELGRNWQAWLH
ncbi:MAG: hypothetical protein EOM26_10695 [Alphaproteobacteria bacterium]|nr:hypothetical protein [Alphaproteobacteria bacterium]